jgi:hypothetical protein
VSLWPKGALARGPVFGQSPGVRLQVTSLVCTAWAITACGNNQFVRATKDAGPHTDGSAGKVNGAGGRSAGGGATNEKDADVVPVSSGGRRASGAKDATSDVDSLDAATDDPSCDGSSCGDAAIACKKTDDCPEDRYCGATGFCVRCTDLGSTDPAKILFGEPEPLSAVNAGADLESLRNPRVFDGGTKLLYVHDFAGTASIWLTGNLNVDPGSPIGPPIGQSSESAPLKVPSGTGMFGGYNFFFDRAVPDDAGVKSPRIIYGAHVDAVGRTAAITALPAPFNDFPRTGNGFGLSRKRAFWTKRLDNVLNVQLWTAPVEGDIIGTRVNLTMPNGCPAYELDYSVWASWDGTFILIAYTERDENCVQSIFSNDVGLVRVSASGQAVGNVVPLNVNLPGISDNDPSLSPDMCFMYFVSTRHKTQRYRIYRARRQH